MEYMRSGQVTEGGGGGGACSKCRQTTAIQKNPWFSYCKRNQDYVSNSYRCHLRNKTSLSTRIVERLTRKCRKNILDSLIFFPKRNYIECDSNTFIE